MHGHTGRSDGITILGLTNFGKGGFDYEKGMSMIDWDLAWWLWNVPAVNREREKKKTRAQRKPDWGRRSLIYGSIDNGQRQIGMVNPTQWLNMPIRHFSPTEVLYGLVKHSINVTQTHNTVQWLNMPIRRSASKKHKISKVIQHIHQTFWFQTHRAKLIVGLPRILTLFCLSLHSWIAADNIKSYF